MPSSFGFWDPHLPLSTSFCILSVPTYAFPYVMGLLLLVYTSLQILSSTFRILNIRCIFPNSNYSPELHPELQMWVKFSTFCQLDTIETVQNSNFHTWPGSFYPPTCFYFHVPQFSKTFILRCGGFETCLRGFFVFALFFWHYFHRERYCSCSFLINFGGIVIASVNIVLLKFPYEIFEIGS